MLLLSKLPARARLLEAKKLSAQIFQQPWNPDNVRNGQKILAEPLLGPKVKDYYGVNESMPTFKDFKKWFPDLGLVDPREEYRVKMLIDRKRRNKGAPKKKKS